MRLAEEEAYTEKHKEEKEEKKDKRERESEKTTRHTNAGTKTDRYITMNY